MQPSHPTKARDAVLRVIDAQRELRKAAEELITVGTMAQQAAAQALLRETERTWWPVAQLGATV